MLGAIPVPVRADAVADELAHVPENAGVAMVAAQDQEQVGQGFLHRHAPEIPDPRAL